MATSKTPIKSSNAAPQNEATPAGAPKPPFVPPRLTKQGRVATVTQDDGDFGASFEFGDDDDDDG